MAGWEGIEQSFTEQFEKDGSSFVYRRSQKGVAIRVSAAERTKFLDDFGQDLRRAKWICYAGLALVLGGLLGFSLFSHSDLSQITITAGIASVIVPYFVYFQRAWAGPGRELSRRTPIAGERSPEEVKRLRFARMKYNQLAAAAFGGAVLPFLGSAHEGVFSGWNKLWLVLGGGLIVLAAVQTFRKWRFEHEDLNGSSAARSPDQDIIGRAAAISPAGKAQWRYLFLAVILIGPALIAYTPEGKQLAKAPSFWPIIMVGGGAWSLFTVARGLSAGRIEPIARGFYTTYERQTQPKRFWASMSWNALFRLADSVSGSPSPSVET